MKPLVLVINGPNLNLLGAREPGIYGTHTLQDLEARITMFGENLGLRVECRQSNHEGEIVDWIQEARLEASGIVLNAAAYTHTSIAIHDALLAAEVPTIEVHLSNIHAREDFRARSYVSSVANGVIVGLGIEGYEFALQVFARRVGRSVPDEPISA